MCVAIMGFSLVALHWLLLHAWRRLACLRKRSLPELLVFPRCGGCQSATAAPTLCRLSDRSLSLTIAAVQAPARDVS
jgi:hypothetical protein